MSSRYVQCEGDPANETDTVCDSIICSENHHENHECIECMPGKYRHVLVMTRVVLTRIVYLLFATKTNMYQEKNVPCHPGTYNVMEMIQVVLSYNL